MKATLSPGPPACCTLLLLCIRMNPHTHLVTHVRVILHYILSWYVYSCIGIRFHILHWILSCFTDANYAISTATIVTSKTPSDTPSYVNKIYSLLRIIIISGKLERPRSYLPAADEYGVYCRNSFHDAITAIRVCIIIIWWYYFTKTTKTKKTTITNVNIDSIKHDTNSGGDGVGGIQWR